MADEQREGPQVIGLCLGCRHYQSTPYRVQGDSGYDRRCLAAQRDFPDSYGDQRTPDWCPHPSALAAAEQRADREQQRAEAAESERDFAAAVIGHDNWTLALMYRNERELRDEARAERDAALAQLDAAERLQADAISRVYAVEQQRDGGLLSLADRIEAGPAPARPGECVAELRSLDSAEGVIAVLRRVGSLTPALERYVHEHYVNAALDEAQRTVRPQVLAERAAEGTMQAHADIEADSTTPLRGLRVGDGARSRHLRNDAGELIAKCGSHRTAILIVAAVAERDRLAAQIRESRAAAYRGCAAELRDKAEKLRKRTADTGAWEWAARLLEGYADRWEGRALSRSLAAGPAQPAPGVRGE